MALRETESQSTKQIYGHNGNYFLVTVTLKQDASASGDTEAGTLLGQFSATKKFFEYDDSAIDGTEVAKCILRDTIREADRKAGDVAVSVLYPQRAVYRASALVGEDANGLADLGATAVEPGTNGVEFYII